MCSSEACKWGANANEHGFRINSTQEEVLGQSEISAKEENYEDEKTNTNYFGEIK